MDILTNAAGIVRPQRDWLNANPDMIEWGIQVNLMGSIYRARYAAEQMASRKSGVICQLQEHRLPHF